MTKRGSNKSNKPNSKNTVILAVVAVVILVFGGILIMTNQPADTTVTATVQSQTISPSDYVSNFSENNTEHILIDVRTPEEFASGHIAGAINIPVQELEQRLSEVPDDQEIVVYCRSGNRSATASQILTSQGYDGIYDMGGIIAWQQAGLPVQ